MIRNGISYLPASSRSICRGMAPSGGNIIAQKWFALGGLAVLLSFSSATRLAQAEDWFAPGGIDEPRYVAVEDSFFNPRRWLDRFGVIHGENNDIMLFIGDFMGQFSNVVQVFERNSQDQRIFIAGNDENGGYLDRVANQYSFGREYTRERYYSHLAPIDGVSEIHCDIGCPTDGTYFLQQDNHIFKGDSLDFGEISGPRDPVAINGLTVLTHNEGGGASLIYFGDGPDNYLLIWEGDQREVIPTRGWGYPGIPLPDSLVVRGAAVPEPSSLVLFLFATAVGPLIGMRRSGRLRPWRRIHRASTCEARISVKQRVTLALMMVFALSLSARAQFTNVINAPPTIIENESVLESGTQLNVYEGGQVGRFLHVGSPDVVNEHVEANIFGGTVLGAVRVNDGGLLNIMGGKVDGISPSAGGRVVMSGGELGGLYANDGSLIELQGGYVGNENYVQAGSRVVISGGIIGDAVMSEPTSRLEIRGEDFRIDGVPIPGLSNPGDTLQLDILDRSSLTGVFSDGNPFAFNRSDRIVDSWITSGGDIFAEGTLVLTVAEAPLAPPRVITVSTEDAPSSIRGEQRLIVDDGAVVPKHFQAGRGSVVDVEDFGIVKAYMEATGATINIEGGFVGDLFDAYDGTFVSMTGGNLGYFADFFAGSRGRFSGGDVGSASAFPGSEIEVTGDVKFWGQLGSRTDSRILVSGGELNDLSISGGYVSMKAGTVVSATASGILEMVGGAITSDLRVHPDARITIAGGEMPNEWYASHPATLTFVGTEFYLDGSAIAVEEYGQAIHIEARDVSLVGQLEDGSPLDIVLDTNPRTANDLFEQYFFSEDIAVEVIMTSPLPGDFDSNGIVDQADLDLVLLNWGNNLFSSIELGWINDLSEGAIDQGELDAVLLHWGQTATPPSQPLASASVPEPASMALLSLGILCLARRKA